MLNEDEGVKEIDGVDKKLGMSKEEAWAVWDKRGRPVIHLGPGQNCFDLAEFLSLKEIIPDHLAAIKKWLSQNIT